MMYRSVCRTFDSDQDQYAQFEFMYSSKAKEIFFKHSDLKHNCAKMVRALDIEKQAVKKAFENDQVRARRSHLDYKQRKEQIVQDKIINDLTRQQLMRNQSPNYRYDDDKAKRQLSSSSSMSEEQPAIQAVEEEDENETTFLTQHAQRRQCQSAPTRKMSALHDPTRPEVTLMRQRKAALRETQALLQKKMGHFMDSIDHFVKGDYKQAVQKQKVSFQVSAQDNDHAQKPRFIRSQSAAAIVSKSRAANSKSRQDILAKSRGEETDEDKLPQVDEEPKNPVNAGRRTSISMARIDELVYGKSGPSTMVSPNPTTPGERRRSLNFITDTLAPESRETLSASSRKKQTKPSKQIFEENKEKIMDAWLEFSANDKNVEGMKKLGRMAAKGREEYNAARKKSLANSDAYQQFESFKRRRGSSTRRASTASSVSVERKKRHVSLPASSNRQFRAPEMGLIETNRENVDSEGREKTNDSKSGDRVGENRLVKSAPPAKIEITDGKDNSSITESSDHVKAGTSEPDEVKVAELTIQAVEEANAMWKKIQRPSTGNETRTDDGATGDLVGEVETEGTKERKGNTSEQRRKGIVVKKHE